MPIYLLHLNGALPLALENTPPLKGPPSGFLTPKPLIMVTVVDYQERTAESGEGYFSLILQGEIEIVVSKNTGRPYATAGKASMPCTFDEPTCASMVGKELPGSIKRVDCEPYEYTIPESGETIELSHRWEYIATEVQIPKLPFSENGLKVA